MVTVESFLAHYGVKGMKWGVRRSRSASSRSRASDDKPKAKDLSDEDLKKAISRMQLERQYSELIKSKGKGRTTKAGADFVKEIGKNVAKTAITSIATQQVNKAMKNASK